MADPMSAATFKVEGAREVRPGVWEIRVDQGRDPLTGKRRRVSRYVHTTRKGDVVKAVAASRVEATEAKAPETSGTFGHLLTEWMRMQEPNLKRSTFAGYQRVIANTLMPKLGHVELRKLTPKHFDDIYTAMSAAGKAPSTINGVHAVARGALNQALTWGWVNTNVAMATKKSRPKLRKVRHDAMPTIAELHTLVEHVATWDSDLGRVLMVSAALGVRRGELCGLRWSDVDWSRGTISVSRAVLDTDGHIYLDTPKSHQARTLSLDANTVALLREHRANVEERATWAGTTLVRDAYLFSREADGSGWLPPDVVTNAFASACKAVGLVDGNNKPTVRLHDLRHLNASLQLAAGVPVATVSKRLGHADPSITLRIYTHAMPADDVAAADTLGSLLGTPQPKALVTK
jgi:integrase